MTGGGPAVSTLATQLAGGAWAVYSQVSRWKIHLVDTTEDLQPAFPADAAVT